MTHQELDRHWIRVFELTFLAVVANVVTSPLSAASAETQPPIEEAGVDGGLAVWVGSHLGPAEWAEALSGLRTNKGMLVLGLHLDPEVVAATQTELVRRNQYGPVSVDTLPGRAERSLPMIDESVNLLIVSSGQSVSHDEALRVLAPLGAALVDKGGTWTKITKPWAEDIDEWTHYLHDASNNAVAQDQRVGPPRHLQWQCGPRWSRHHDHMASVSAMVSARGRMFCILDEGSRVSPQLPPDWKLVARDAFNGVLLWKRTIDEWHNHLWPLKSGPANLPRRLVAQGEEVFATLGIQAPVTALRAGTGETLRQYAGTSGAEEILYKDGILLVLANRTPLDLDADLENDPEEGKSRDGRTTYSPTMGRIWAGVRSGRWTHGDRRILAFDAQSGRLLWEKAGRVIPLTLAADDDNAYYHDGDKIVALQLANGRQRWASEAVPVWQGLDGQGLQSWFAPNLVVHGGSILLAGGEKMHMSYMGWGSEDIGEDTMSAFSAETGEKLWTADHPYGGYNSPEDLLVANGKVWAGATAKGSADGRYIGRDPRNGEIDDELPPTVKTFWFHHRCYRAKATDNYILCSRTGIELVDLETGQWTINHWVRGGCLYGIMPCNGLIYSPPHPCACYPEAKLYGFTALRGSRVKGPESRARERLEPGPAHGSSFLPPSALRLPPSKAWPTYRHDPARSGATSSSIPAGLRPQWTVRAGDGLTQPIMADGRLFLAEVDRHAVHAIDAGSGEKLWTYTAGGRIDSPPTYDRGRLLFGAANGYVYCLRASDGALAWRFRAAPVDRRLVAFDQVESVWPVHGSVLVQDGVVSLVAGRTMYLDGGLRLCRLDVETGRLLSEKVLDDRDPETGENMQVHLKGLTMPVALPDILSSDGEHLFMRSQTMDLEGNRLGFGPGKGEHDHLFAAFGFTDDSWFHRSYWLYGDGFLGGAGGYTKNGRVKPGGRILVDNDTTVFGYGRKQQYYRWTSVMEYQLFAAAKPGVEGGSPREKPARGKSAVKYRWTCEVPMMVRAMALAGDTLFIAGPHDLVDEEASFQNFPDEAVQKQLALQDAALEGESGAILQAVDAETGEMLADYPLDSPPVFDGLIVADGRLFLATMDGRLMAFVER
jgi:outer membrane protein assembly factor BamB